MNETEAKKLAMTEWSLSRAYDSFVHSGTKSFAVLTSWRYDKDPATNKANFQRFKSQAGSAGHGYIELRGHWTGDNGQDSIESSLWINGIPLEDARALAGEYGQEAFVFAGAETQGAVTLFFTAGGSKVIGSKFSPSSFAMGYSTWKGRAFHFEHVYGSPRWLIGMALGAHVKRFVNKLLGETQQ
jgi:hypothetical protein